LPPFVFTFFFDAVIYSYFHGAPSSVKQNQNALEALLGTWVCVLQISLHKLFSHAPNTLLVVVIS
jgi:hypothetical protein